MAIGNAADIKSSGGEKLATIDRGPLSEPRGLVREMMTKGNTMGVWVPHTGGIPQYVSQSVPCFNVVYFIKFATFEKVY